ncbi:MAG TPA: hypothetical protein VG406_03270 [Isosphaeraceae bacterium]|nr:hypothetical protein [Isosphaeraceae bacterium]
MAVILASVRTFSEFQRKEPDLLQGVVLTVMFAIAAVLLLGPVAIGLWSLVQEYRRPGDRRP